LAGPRSRVIVSAVVLVLGVVAYGFAGARLYNGARHEGGALHSSQWWMGTGLQAIGSLLVMVARRSLPLLLVQATSTAGLAVTAVIQHVEGVDRLTRKSALAIVSLVGGLGLLGAATIPGPASTIRPSHLVLLVISLAVCAAGIAVTMPGLASGVLAGLGFSVGAIAARLVIGDQVHPVWIFWHLPLANWLCGFITAAGIAVGQVHLTRGLARHAAKPVLGAMYLVETVFPALVGLTILDEHPRTGMGVFVVIGAMLVLLGSWDLLRNSKEGQAIAEPAV